MLRIKTLTLTYITFGIAFFILGAIIILNTIIEGFSSLIYSILLIICLTFVLISSFLFLTARTGAKPKSKKKKPRIAGVTELVIISSGIILSLIYTSSYYNQNKVRSLPSFNSIPNHSQNNSTGNTPYRTNDDNTSNNPLQYQKNNNLIECIGPDGKTFNTTQTECDKLNSAWGVTPTPNPDQIIQCEIDTACGGGYREMKRSACLSMVCCETVSGWIVTARDVCSQTHKSTTNSFCYDIYNSYQSTNDSVCGLYKDKSLFPTSKEYNDCIDNQNKQNSEYLNKCLNN